MHPLLTEAESISSSVIEVRRRIHQHPELGLHLPATQTAVTETLDELGIGYRLGESLSSVVAAIEGNRPGPDVILRAEMDALPLSENTGLDFASEVDGVMHACGHDTHVAMLLGACRLLVKRRDDFSGRVVLMFQPGEEGFGGAQIMLAEGLLDGVHRERATAFAIHTTAAFAAGTLSLRSGPILAATDSFEIDVIGRGGHASEPHRTVDPIPVAAEIILALQAMVTRRVNACDPAVLTVTRIQGGTTHNVIPDQATLMGTIRTLSETTRTTTHDLLHRVVNGVAAAHGVTAEVRLKGGYPATVNDVEVAAMVHDVAAGLLGADAVHTMPTPRMSGEDFSYVLEQVPGAMAFLGGRPDSEDPATAPMNHSSRVVFDESVLSTGVAMHVAVVLRTLGRHVSQSGVPS
jgi:hippurate hydrolase